MRLLKDRVFLGSAMLFWPFISFKDNAAGFSVHGSCGRLLGPFYRHCLLVLHTLHQIHLQEVIPRGLIVHRIQHGSILVTLNPDQWMFLAVSIFLSQRNDAVQHWSKQLFSYVYLWCTHLFGDLTSVLSVWRNLFATYESWLLTYSDHHYQLDF